MNSVLFMCSQQVSSHVQARLETGARASYRALSERVPERFSSTLLPEVNGGWVRMLPQDPAAPVCVAEYIAPDLAVLVIGRMYHSKRPAQLVAATFQQGGIRAVRQLNGSFATVIVNRHERRVYCCSDLIGHLSLRRVEHEGTLYLSPHDVPLVAASGCGLALDLTSVLSVVATDWSTGGRPYLRAVGASDPLGWLEWQGGQTVLKDDPEGITSRRLGASESPNELRAQVNRVGQTLVKDVGALAEQAEQIVISLTAGADSRLLLALLAAAGCLSKTEAVTGGTSLSMDMLGAKGLARSVGIPHQQVNPAEERVDFDQALSLYAFHFNGESNGKRALGAASAPSSKLWLTGGAGEIYRGYYYAVLAGASLQLAPAQVAARLFAKLTGSKARQNLLRSTDPGIVESLKQRLGVTCERLASWSDEPHDLLDAFYLLERYGRWGSIVSRRTWRPMWSPLASCDAVRQTFQLPSPIGLRGELHRQLCSRHLPKAAYHLPVNGGELLALGDARANRVLRKVGIAAVRALAKVESGTRAPSAASLLAGPLYHDMRERLLASDSLSCQLFSSDAVDKLLREHQAKQSLLQPLGFLLAAEAWWRQVNDAASASQADRT